MEKRSKLRIETVNERSEVEIAGTPADIMLSYAALTTQICNILNIQPVALAMGLPQTIAAPSRRKMASK